SADGALNRATTRERVFSDASAKRKLEAVLHPMIHEEVAKSLRSERVVSAPYAVLVVPLLFETLTYRHRAHRTLLIDCPTPSQTSRVSLRAGLDAASASRIVAAQLPRSVRLQLADDVIWNGGSIDALESHIPPLHLRYLRLAEKAR
ncbi:MAG: dephospho-CoA kinase, partial [Usitatibacteraceae bacterium]